MKLKINKWKWIIVLLIISISIVNAKIEFYTGAVSIKSQNALVSIEKKANIKINYVLINNQAQDATVEIEFTPTDEKQMLNFKGNEEKTLSFVYEKEVSEDNFKNIKFEPNVKFDGKELTEKIGEIYTKIIFPTGIKKLVSFNPENSGEGNEDDRLYYEWIDTDSYFTSIFVSWNELGNYLKVEKEVNKVTRIDQDVDVKIIVKNTGDKEIKNILLEDNFLPTEFEAVEPAEEFTIISGGNDERLIWEKQVDLNVDETKVLEYSVKPLNLQNKISLNGLRVLIGESLAASTKDLNVEVEFCGNNRCDIEVKEYVLNCPKDCPAGSKDNYCDKLEDKICDPDCKKTEDKDCMNLIKKYILIGITILVLGVGLFYFLRIKKKKTTKKPKKKIK